MSNADRDPVAFALGDDFVPGEVSGGLGLGPLGAQYEELFAEALEDGVITATERAQLDQAASNLGLDRDRLLQLEQAMVDAYEAHHLTRIVEQYQRPSVLPPPVDYDPTDEAGRESLIAHVHELEARIQELEAELRRAQGNVNVEVNLADLDTSAAAAAEDADACWRRVRRDPLNVDALRALARVHAARHETDKHWCVAQALVLLDGATAAERDLFEQHHASALIAPTAGVSASAWYDYLFHTEADVLTGQIFGLIAPAVLLGRVTALRRDGQLFQPDASCKQEAPQSTVTAVRALTWGASILGLAPPPTYVDPDRDTAFEHIPAIPPLTVVGRRALSGRSQLEHAFLVGQHLCWYREEHYVRTLFSAVTDLEDLFLAALTIGSPSLPIAADLKRRVGPIAKAIEPVLEASRLDKLRGCFLQFVEEGGRTNLQRWSAAVEKTACRAGLLLCNDLKTAAGLLEPEEGEHGKLLQDILSYSVGERYFQLRQQLGIAIPQG